MIKLLYSLALIIGSLLIGLTIHKATKNSNKKRLVSNQIILILRNFAFFGLTPIVTLNAFWIVDLKSITVISVPLIGIGALIAGTLFSLLFSKIYKHNRLNKGAMFCCGSSSNIGTIGALICFVFFGEAGFAFCALYRLFELPYLYLIVYPAAKTFSYEKEKQGETWFKKLITDPIIIVYFSCIAIGIILNFFNLPRPKLLEKINAILIPLSSSLLIVAIGYSMRFSKIVEYKKEVLSISVIKYVITPFIVIMVSLLLKLDNLAEGILFKTLVVLSALPCGFNSLIPVQMYKLNINLANSCWIVTTALLVVVIPTIWLLII